MDGVSTMTEIRQTFRTPLRILVPKILKSRDDWKAKSDRRKVQLKSSQIKVRDLTLSREHWRQTAEAAQEEVRELREQLQQSQNELAQTRAALTDLQEAKKK
jgi:chromosome segregation ATPase